MKLTEKLDVLMEERKLNKAELSRNTRVPYTTIASLYEKGYDNIKLSTLKRLARYLDCSIDYLADDNINDRYYMSNISNKETRMLDTYIEFKNSDDPKLNALADAIDRILGIDEPDNDETK